MDTATMIGFALSFAILNRGRGSHFWDSIDSTAASRLLAAFSMAVLTMLAAGQGGIAGDLTILWALGTLSLWEVFAWDNYWSAAIGHAFNPGARTFLPADWLMRRMPWFAPVYSATAGDVRRRLWGTVAMGLRQSVAAPCIVGLAWLTGHPDHGWYAAGTLLLGLPYLLAGYACRTYAIGFAEYTVGGWLGILMYTATH